MFASLSKAILVVALLSGCDWGESHRLECDDPPCIKDIIVQDTRLIAVESEVVEAVAVVQTTDGLRVTMVGDCAYGNLSGNRIRFAYSSEWPEWISTLLITERLPSVAVPNRIVEVTREAEFAREGIAIIRQDVMCFD